jgi:hypothetical protein
VQAGLFDLLDLLDRLDLLDLLDLLGMEGSMGGPSIPPGRGSAQSHGRRIIVGPERRASARPYRTVEPTQAAPVA